MWDVLAVVGYSSSYLCLGAIAVLAIRRCLGEDVERCYPGFCLGSLVGICLAMVLTLLFEQAAPAWAGDASLELTGPSVWNLIGLPVVVSPWGLLWLGAITSGGLWFSVWLVLFGLRSWRSSAVLWIAAPLVVFLHGSCVPAYASAIPRLFPLWLLLLGGLGAWGQHLLQKRGRAGAENAGRPPLRVIDACVVNCGVAFLLVHHLAPALRRMALYDFEMPESSLWPWLIGVYVALASNVALLLAVTLGSRGGRRSFVFRRLGLLSWCMTVVLAIVAFVLLVMTPTLGLL